MTLRSAVLAIAVAVAPAAASPVAVRYPEGPTHGFLVLRDDRGSELANGELIQWLERGGGVASRLVIRFGDGSLYDELVRFTQQPVFRVTSYRLAQRGPSFAESTTVEFDAGGRYDVRRRASPDAAEEHAAGQTTIPEDVANGMASTLLKNLVPYRSANVHVVAFRPNPLVVDVRLEPEGVDRCRIGTESLATTRFAIRAHVPGAKGALATVAGKQPADRRMWIVQGRAPSLVRFEGPLYDGGPTWHVELAPPRWDG